MAADRNSPKRRCSIQGREGRFWLVLKQRRQSRVRQIDDPQARDELVETSKLYDVSESRATTPKTQTIDQPPLPDFLQQVPTNTLTQPVNGKERRWGTKDRFLKQLRIREVESLLLAATHDTHVLVEIQTRFELSENQARCDIKEAKQNILDATRKDHHEHLAEAINFYRQIITDPDEPTVNRIKAQTRLDKLLGLEAPQRHILFPATEATPFHPATQRQALQDPAIRDKAVELDELLAQAAGETPTSPIPHRVHAPADAILHVTPSHESHETPAP